MQLHMIKTDADVAAGLVDLALIDVRLFTVIDKAGPVPLRRLPPGSMNRRQVEALAGSGAFDALEPNRAKVFASAEILMGAADAALRERESGQAGLFGGEDHAEPSLRLADVEPWSRTEQMAQERDNFGFYFAAHPVEQYRAVASANGARSYAGLMDSGVASGRSAAVMAAMVEGVNRGKTRKGADFVRADFSDSSGQFSAACFEESLVEPFVKWAREGTCVLLNVELDSPNPDEPPRVTVRGARPLAEVKSGARMRLTLEVSEDEAQHMLATLLPAGEKGKGEVFARLRTASGSDPLVRLGDAFQLDGELAERLQEVPGIAKVALSAAPGNGRHLRLVA